MEGQHAKDGKVSPAEEQGSRMLYLPGKEPAAKADLEIHGFFEDEIFTTKFWMLNIGGCKDQ